MSPMDPRARIGDADREQTVAELQRYAAEGYLTLDEFSDRSAAVYRAKTYGELATLTADVAPRGDPHRDRSPAGRASARITWTPLVIVVAVLVGAVVLGAVVMLLMMLGMMGGMGMSMVG